MANIFSLFGTIFIDNEKANKAIDKTTAKGKDGGKSLGQSFTKIAKGASVVGTAAVGMAATMGVAVFKAAKKTAEYADNVDEMSVKLGLSKKAYQEWDYIMSQNGVNIESMTSGMKAMTTSMASLAEGGKKGTDTLAKLGITVDDLKNKSQEQIFEDSVRALQKMPAGYEKARLAQQLFGRQGQELLPILNATKGTVDEMKKEANDLGAVMGDKAVAAGAKLGDTLDALKKSGTGIFNILGSALVPIVQNFAELIIKNMPAIQNILTTLSPVIGDLFNKLLPPLLDLANQVLPIVASLIAMLLPYITDIITTLLPTIVDLLNFFLPPFMQIIQLLMPLIAQLLPPLLQLIQPLLPLLQPIFDLILQILSPLVELLNMILPPLIKIITKFINLAIIPLQYWFTVISGVVSGAFKMAFDGIKNTFETAKKVFTGIIDFVKKVFKGDWKGAWEAVKQIFDDIWSGIKKAFKIPINFIIDGINAFIRGINKIKIPDWVPAVGGKEFNLKEIKRLRVGLEYVPYDDFPALLHKGEQVLTASQKKEYDAMKSGGHSQTVNINIAPGAVSIGKIDKDTDINALKNEIVNKIVVDIKKKGLAFA